MQQCVPTGPLPERKLKKKSKRIDGWKHRSKTGNFLDDCELICGSTWNWENAFCTLIQYYDPCRTHGETVHCNPRTSLTITSIPPLFHEWMILNSFYHDFFFQMRVTLVSAGAIIHPSRTATGWIGTTVKELKTFLGIPAPLAKVEKLRPFSSLDSPDGLKVGRKDIRRGWYANGYRLHKWGD